MSIDVCDDEHTLLHSPSLDGGVDNTDPDGQERDVSLPPASSSRVSCDHVPASRFFCNRIWHLLLASIVLVTVSTGMVVTLPVYLNAINIQGTAYSGILFIWLVVTAVATTYCCAKYRSLDFLHNSTSASELRRALQYGCWHGLACLAVVYSLDRKRVLCHAQEPLMGLIVLYMILLYCFYRGPVLSSSKLVCLCGVLAGLFLAMDFQLNDIYLCRGQLRTSPATDGGPWSMQEHALWTVVYAGALFGYTMAWIKMEQLMGVVGKHRINNDEVNTVSGQLVLNNSSSLPQSPLLLRHTPPSRAPPAAAACERDVEEASTSNAKQTFTTTGRCNGVSNSSCCTSNNSRCPNNDSCHNNTSCPSKSSCPNNSSCHNSDICPINGRCHNNNSHSNRCFPTKSSSSHTYAPPARRDSGQQYCSSVSLTSCQSLCSSVSSVTLYPAAAATDDGFTSARFDVLVFWFLLATLAAVLAMFWTDLFTALGKSGSVKQFANLTGRGLLCHFRGLQPCGPTALHGWLMVLYMLLFLGSVRVLCVSSRSIIFPLSVASLALPLSALFWGACMEGGPYGVMWAPTVTGELVFSSFGLPVMIGCLVYWAKLDIVEADKTLLRKTVSTTRSTFGMDSAHTSNPQLHCHNDNDGISGHNGADQTNISSSSVHKTPGRVPQSDEAGLGGGVTEVGACGGGGSINRSDMLERGSAVEGSLSTVVDIHDGGV